MTNSNSQHDKEENFTYRGIKFIWNKEAERYEGISQYLAFYIERKTRANFECKVCGFRINADLNASRNIRVKAYDRYNQSYGAKVNKPNVSPPLAAGTSPCL